jgi:5'-nucleotidase
VLLNVNFPDRPADGIAGVRVTVQGRRQVGLQIDSRIDPDGRPYFWVVDYSNDAPMRANSDLRAVQDGTIAITPLCLDLTHRASLKRLRDAFS